MGSVPRINRPLAIVSWENIYFMIAFVWNSISLVQPNNNSFSFFGLHG